LLVLIIVIGIAYFAWVVFYTYKAGYIEDTNNITISATGEVYAAPDIAALTLGIQTDGKDVKTITQKNTETMNKIIDGVKSLGLEAKDIQTTQYSVSPQYNWTQDKGQVLEGYRITQNIDLKIRDFKKIGDILGVATENGANIVSDLRFSIEDEEKAKAQAREKAITSAKAKAQTIAQQAGIKLGEIINVYEDYYYTPVQYSSAKVMNDMVSSGSAREVAQVESGEQQVQITINLVYKIK
jgi:hypothetical protein